MKLRNLFLVYTILRKPRYIDETVSPTQEELVADRPGPARSVDVYEFVMPVGSFMLCFFFQAFHYWIHLFWANLVCEGIFFVFLLISFRNRYFIPNQSQKVRGLRRLLLQMQAAALLLMFGFTLTDFK